MILYKTIKDNWKSENGNCKWELNKWKKIRGEINLCEKGFHASPRIIDAMGYVFPGLICEVETRGKSLDDGNKSVWSEMRIIKFCKWEKEDSVALAIYAAEKVIKNFEEKFPKDDRPRKAIQAAKAWLKNPTEENRSAAWSAARSAAESAWSAAEYADRSAARSAWSAARSAWSAEYAARSAAWSAESAARSAAWSAEYAARSAACEKILNDIEKWIKRRLNKKEEK